MNKLENSLFQIKFTAKQFSKQSKKCKKDEEIEKQKLKMAIKNGKMEEARIHAANAIRKKNEALNLEKLSAQIDTAVNRLQIATTYRKMTMSMASVVKSLSLATETMNLEQISKIMGELDTQLENVEVQAECMEGAIGGSMQSSAPQEDVNLLMEQATDEAGLLLDQELGELGSIKDTPNVAEPSEHQAQRTQTGELELEERLRKLRQ